MQSNKNLPEIINLFRTAETELEEIPFADSIELGFEQFQRSVSRQDCIALFDFAEELIEKPEKEEKVVKEVRTSHKRVVEATELKQKLAQVEKKITPGTVSLRDVGRGKKGKQKDETEVFVKVPKVDIGTRLQSFIIDSMIVVGMSVPGALLIEYFDSPDLVYKAFNPNSLAIFEWVSLIGGYFAAFFLLIIAIPLWGLIFQQRSLGMKLSGLKVVRLNGKHASFSHLTIRGLCAPFAILTLGAFTFLRRDHHGLHELISRTTVVPESFLGPDDVKDAS